MTVKLDLGKHHANMVMFESEVELPEQLLVQVETLAPPGKRDSGIYYYSANYAVAKVRHGAHVHMMPLGKPGVYSVGFMYSTGRTLPRRKAEAFRSLPSVLRCLSTMDMRVDFSCRADFDYDEGVDKSLVRLPIQMFTGKAMPFTEVQGVRVASKEGKTEAYSAIIEVIGSTLHHHLSFGLTASFSMDLPEKVLLRAVELSNVFLVSS